MSRPARARLADVRPPVRARPALPSPCCARPPPQSLPDDIKCAILAFFPDKDCALALRATCRAWLAAFDAGVATIAIHSSSPAGAAAPRFPALRHLCVTHTGAPAAKAAVARVAVPSAATLAVLEVSHVGLAEPPSELWRLSRLITLSLTACRLRVLSGAKLHLLPQLQVLVRRRGGQGWRAGTARPVRP